MQRGRVGLEQELLVDRRRSARRRAARTGARRSALSAKPTENVRTGSRALLRHHRDDDARVDPAREERAERHVGDEALADGVRTPSRTAVEPLVLVERSPPAAARAASSARSVTSAVLDDEQADPGGGAGCPRAPSRRPGRSRVRGTRRAARGSTRRPTPGNVSSAFSSDAKATEPSGELRPEERLLAEAVAGEQEPLAARVPEREREHAVEVLDEAVAVLLVEVRERRRVAGARERVAAGARARARSSRKL